jgi:hypothetical protein
MHFSSITLLFFILNLLLIFDARGWKYNGHKLTVLCSGGLVGTMNMNRYWKIWRMRSFRKRNKLLLGSPFSMRDLCLRILHHRLQDCLTCCPSLRFNKIPFQFLTTSHLFSQILSHYHILLLHPMSLRVAQLKPMCDSSIMSILKQVLLPFVEFAIP